MSWFPLIDIIFTYLKLEGADITVDDLPHDYVIVNEFVFEVRGNVSSTVETTI